MAVAVAGRRATRHRLSCVTGRIYVRVILTVLVTPSSVTLTLFRPLASFFVANFSVAAPVWLRLRVASTVRPSLAWTGLRMRLLEATLMVTRLVLVVLTTAGAATVNAAFAGV